MCKIMLTYKNDSRELKYKIIFFTKNFRKKVSLGKNQGQVVEIRN